MGGPPPVEYDAAGKAYTRDVLTHKRSAAHEYDLLPPPPPPPDLADEELQKARAAMVKRQLLGQGTASTFFTGPLGDLTTAPILKPSASGT